MFLWVVLSLYLPLNPRFVSLSRNYFLRRIAYPLHDRNFGTVRLLTPPPEVVSEFFHDPPSEPPLRLTTQRPLNPTQTDGSLHFRDFV